MVKGGKGGGVEEEEKRRPEVEEEEVEDKEEGKNKFLTIILITDGYVDCFSVGYTVGAICNVQKKVLFSLENAVLSYFQSQTQATVSRREGHLKCVCADISLPVSLAAVTDCGSD